MKAVKPADLAGIRGNSGGLTTPRCQYTSYIISALINCLQRANIVSNSGNFQGCYHCENGSLAWNFHMSCGCLWLVVAASAVAADAPHN